MGIKQDFKVYCSTNFIELNKSLIENAFEDNDELILEGIASTTSIDEEGDYMTESCLEDMKRQAIGLSVLKEHGRTLDDIIGKVVGIPSSDSETFKIKFKVLPRHRFYLLDLLENGINLGLSIGARAVEYEPIEDSDYGWKVNKAKLYEISLIPLPANWDSFGSVKISKELDNDVVVAKCFNGACKQLVKEYNPNTIKELEDTQKNDEEKYLTRKEALSMINEEAIAIYDRVLSEVLDEIKREREKNHLNEENNSNKTEKSENSNDENKNSNSSKDKEDEEKEKSMKEEIDKKVESEETPNVQKNLEELEGTSEGDETKMEKGIKEQKEEETIDVSVSVDEVSNKDVLKSIEDLKSFMSKSIDEEIEAKFNAKIEEIEKKLPDVDELKKNLRAEIEDELFKELTTEREPTETEQPKVEEVEEGNEEEEEEVKKAMNSYDIAKMLCS